MIPLQVSSGLYWSLLVFTGFYMSLLVSAVIYRSLQVRIRTVTLRRSEFLCFVVVKTKKGFISLLPDFLLTTVVQQLHTSYRGNHKNPHRPR